MVMLPGGMSNRDHKEILNTLRPLAWDSNRLGECGRELINHYSEMGVDRDEMIEYIAEVIAQLVS